MKKVLFITDSLGLPRIIPELISDEMIWTYQVSRKVCTRFRFFYHCYSGLTAVKIKNSLNNVLAAYNPDIIILQVGIVDCSPRALKFFELAILSRIPIINKITHYVVKKFYKKIILMRNTTYVSLDEFIYSLCELKKFFNKANFIVLPIAPPSDAYKDRNPLIHININKYNQVLESVFKEGFLINLFDNLNTREMFLSDNHHFNEVTNNIVAERLSQILMVNNDL